MKRNQTHLIGTALAGLLFSGCLPLAEEEFKEALPREADLKIVMGESDESEAASRGMGDCPECCVDEETGNYRDADTYAMTRSATYHVNGTLVAVYVWFNFIVNLPYSEEISNGYIWGPWDETDIDPLSRLTYRFKMTRNGDSSFDYGLEVKLLTRDEDNWTPYIYGNVVPTDEPHKGTGTMTIDFDVIHGLDPAHPSELHGRVNYDFDIREVAPTQEKPNTVNTTFVDFWEDEGWSEEQPDPLNAEYKYERYDALSGKLDFVAWADVTGENDEPDGVDETFDIESRWNGIGQGMGVARVSHGSLDELNISSYTLTECWADADSNYFETYDLETLTYTDGTDPLEEQNCGAVENCPSF